MKINNSIWQLLSTHRCTWTGWRTICWTLRRRLRRRCGRIVGWTQSRFTCWTVTWVCRRHSGRNRRGRLSRGRDRTGGWLECRFCRRWCGRKGGDAFIVIRAGRCSKDGLRDVKTQSGLFNSKECWKILINGHENCPPIKFEIHTIVCKKQDNPNLCCDNYSPNSNSPNYQKNRILSTPHSPN